MRFVTFLLDQKSNQKNQGSAEILRFCLVAAAEAKKTRPAPLFRANARSNGVGLKQFFAFTASAPAKSGFLQGRSRSAPEGKIIWINIYPFSSAFGKYPLGVKAQMPRFEAEVKFAEGE
jgi:hypothetical protein